MEQRRRQRPVRARLRRVAAAIRAVEPLPRVTLAAVAALAVLTSSSPPGTRSPSRAPAPAPALGAPPAGADHRITRISPATPELEGLLEADLDVGSDQLPAIPEVGGERELTPFEHSPVGDLGEGEVVPVDLVVRTEEREVDPAALADSLAGARHAAAAAGLAATVPGTDGEDRSVSLLGVDGDTFRPLTPEVTAAADAVWQRFAEGDVLVSHELADELGLELGGTLVLATEAATLPVRVGAFAANGEPPVADVLVPVDVAELLGAAAPNTLLVAAGGGDPGALGDALADATGGEVELLREPAPPVAERRTTEGTPTGHIEPFTYTSRADGRITIHGDWVARNIVRVQLPGMAATSCHRVMVPQLQAVVDELFERDLYGHLDPSQFAGCFVARHIDWDPSKPLSMHAWGLAIDFNTRDNALGAAPTMDRRVVEVFERWGFEWGGHWKRPDGMHFELDRIVAVP